MFLVLEKLKFKGIGRFAEEQTIDFTLLGKFAQLDGFNNNTKGSSGAGKSTVFMALDYLLGVSNRPSTVLKCRFSDEGISVEGTFKYDGKPLTITRGKKLSIDLDGEVTTGNSTKTEEKLDQILGIDRQLFRKMLHKRQGEGGFFLEMSPGETNGFLSSALGHNDTRNKIELVEKKIKELVERETTLATAISSANSALKATEDAILALGLPPVRDIHQSVILELKEKSEKSASALTTATSVTKLEEATLNASRPQILSVPFDRASIEALEEEYKVIDGRILQANSQEKNRQNKAKLQLGEFQTQHFKLSSYVAQGEQALKGATECAEQIKKIRSGKCYTCEQDWVDSKTELKLMNSIKTFREQIESGNQAKLQIPSVEKAIEQWALESSAKEVDVQEDRTKLAELQLKLLIERKKEKDHQLEQDQKNKAALSIFETQESTMRDRHRLTLDQLRGQVDIDRRTFEVALGKLKAHQDAQIRYENTLTSLKTQEESYDRKVKELAISSLNISDELKMAEELKRGLKSYLSCSFDEALETISENATKLIRHIPNMANATIQLEGLRETQDGKIKEEVNAVIHMDGEENVDIRSLCGGERTATDLAIDLSVIDMLESRASKGIDLFILDEPFNGLDTVCIEMALEVLKNSNSNKRMVIVDHNPEVKEMVESKLVVIRDGAISRVVQS